MLRAGLFLLSVSCTAMEVSVDAGGSVRHVRHRPALVRKEAGNASRLEHYDLLVIIPAKLTRDRRRLQAVRDTWARDIDESHRCARCGSNRTVKYLFVLGEEASEADAPPDAVVLPRCSSDYDRLAEKVRRGIHYVVGRYSFNLLLKADTDSWIFLDRLLQFAEDHRLFDGKRAVQAGEVRRHGRPQGAGGRNEDSVFAQLTGQETYPVYTPGCGYLLTRNLCNYISLLAETKSQAGEEALPELQDLPQEDVAVGFWLE
ncbi:unnamed protein product, partial [Effrenium voratum]